MRTFIILFAIVVVSACLLFGCSRHSSHPLLHQADSLLDVAPDSVLALLDSLPVWEDSSEADRAFYALLWAQALDKTEQSLLPCDSLLNYALDYYDDEDWEKAVALMYKGRLLAQMNDEKAAIELNLNALEVLKNYPEDTKYRGLIYSALGVWYKNCRLYDEALEVLKQFLVYSVCTKDTAIAYNGIAHVYARKNLPDSSVFYQRKSVECALQSEDTNMILISWHNLSLRYTQLNEIDSAVFYAKKVVQTILQDKKGKEEYYYNMGGLYIDLEEYDSARYYLEKSLPCNRLRAASYWSLAGLEAELGNYQSAYHYMDSFAVFQDSLNVNAELTEIQHLVYKHQTESRVKDEQLQSHKRMGGIVLFFLAVCFVLVLAFQYRLNKRDKRHALYKQSFQYTKEKLRLMQQQIEEYEVNLALLRDKENRNLDEMAQKEQLITQLKQEKLELRTWLFRQTPVYKTVVSLFDQQKAEKKSRKVMTAAELDQLKKTIFEIYSDYISSLQIQYPRLTEDDLLLLCLQKEDIPALTIALCFGHTDTVALNQRKSRLKAKMSDP